MGTKISLKTTVLLFLLAFLAACGNSKQLETDNKALQAKVLQLTDENSKFKSVLDGLKAELEDLKQTDQYLFSKAKEHLASSNVRDAKELLDKLLTRFPNTAYKTQAVGLLKDVNSKIAIADAVENGESEIKSAIARNDFNNAWSTLGSIKKYISEEKLKELGSMISSEKKKPVDGTIANLDEDFQKYYGWKDVIVSGYINDYSPWGSPYYMHRISLCEGSCNNKGICINVYFRDKDIPQDTIRMFKRLQNCQNNTRATVLIHTQSSKFETSDIAFN